MPLPTELPRLTCQSLMTAPLGSHRNSDVSMVPVALMFWAHPQPSSAVWYVESNVPSMLPV